MARLTRFVMVLGTVFGLNSVAPAPAQAGVIPWMYDAIFGPVGSIRANRATYRYGYGGGMAYSAYAPMSVAYAPVATASYGGYGSGGCSTCSQSANYVPYDAYYGGQSYVGTGCSTCNTCGTGGYAGSPGCSNCSVNPAPSTSYYGGSAVPGSPTPDTSSVLQRLNQLELHQKEIERQLKRSHNSGGTSNDPYQSNDLYPNSTHRPGSLTEDHVPARGGTEKAKKTFESEPDFARPLHKRPAPDAEIEDPIETKKPEMDLAPPVPVPEAAPIETVPQAFRLDSRVTTRAVAPRDRMPVASKPTATKVAQSNKSRKPTTSWLDSSLTSDVSRH